MISPATVVPATALAVVASLGAALPQAAATPEPDHASSESTTCAPPATGRQSVTVTSGGVTFDVLVHVPSDADDAGMPLVFDLHGSASRGAEQLERSQLPATAEDKGFIVAAPDGAIPDGPGFSWNVPDVPLANGDYPPADARDDVQFISDVTDTLVDRWCVDPDRVYSTGYSGGGRMSSALACEWPGVAAIAPVAGLRFGAPDESDPSVPDPDTCVPDRAVPAITFHGMLDTVNPYDGGGTPAWGYSVDEAAQLWAGNNGCRVGPISHPLGRVTDRKFHTACDDGADVVSIVADDGAHTWPGSTFDFGEPVSQEIPANEAMWHFFARHPLQ